MNTWVNHGVKFGSLFVLIMMLTFVIKKNQNASSVVSDSKKTSRKAGAVRSTSEPESPDVSEMEEMRNQGLKVVEKGAFVASEISQLVDKFPNETEYIFRKWLKPYGEEQEEQS